MGGCSFGTVRAPVARGVVAGVTRKATEALSKHSYPRLRVFVVWHLLVPLEIPT